jgi:hypothetical protein
MGDGRQIPSSKFQIPVESEAPSTNIQAPEKPQEPSTKLCDRELGARCDAADCLRYLVATKPRVLVQRKLRGL